MDDGGMTIAGWLMGVGGAVTPGDWESTTHILIDLSTVAQEINRRFRGRYVQQGAMM